MTDEVSESIFKPLMSPFPWKIISFLSIFLTFTALSMSFFIIKSFHFYSFNRFIDIFTFKHSQAVLHTKKPCIHRPLNHLINFQMKINPALLKLLKLTDIDINNNQSLKNIVDNTQRYWLRPSGIERYKLDLCEYDEHSLKKEFLACLKNLNVTHVVRAKYLSTPYDIVLLHGATADEVMTRLQFLISEYKRGVRFHQIVLLTGDRPLHADNEAKYIKLGLKTETEMLEYLWQTTDGLPKSVKQNVHVVDTKGKWVNGTYRRPTTKDTIYQWLDEMPPQKNTRCLAISSQPFVPFQDFVLYNILKKQLTQLSFETIGAKANDHTPIKTHLDNLARCLYELSF